MPNLSVWCTVLLEKLMVALLVKKNFQPFMEPEVQHHVHSNKCIPDGMILCNVRGSSPGGFFSLLHRPDRLWVHTDSYSVGIGDLSRGLRRPGREVDHSPPFSAEVKNEWS